MVDFVEPKQANWVCENHWRTLTGICSADFQTLFQNFLLKTNQQFVEILPTTYIFQSHSIDNIAGKVAWWIKKRYNQIYWCENRSQLYAANQHLFLFRFRLKSKINPLELHDNKIVTLTEFFEGLEISSPTNILYISVENMTA